MENYELKTILRAYIKRKKFIKFGDLEIQKLH